jgi:starch synthase (maltosyl-transferring)
LRNIHFHPTDSDQVIAYSKKEGDNLLLIIVNLDGFHAHETTVHWDMWALGFEKENFEVTDLLDNSIFNWSPHTFVRLDPARPSGKVAHIARVRTK